uniref:Putative u4/u6 small nuclear ribonucleoprotein n=1 Tax=Panstrongylus lignarius TaxID=156445 RepID=A0A224XG85_9HEMI
MSKKDGMDLRWKVDDLIEKFLGFSEPVLAATALNCISNGYDKKKTAEKLGSLLDQGKAERLAEKVLTLGGDEQEKTAKKRHITDVPEEQNHKKLKSDKDGKSEVLSASEIKDMMANAQKMIEERKKSLIAIKGSTAPITTHPSNAQSLKSTSKTLPPILSQTVSNLRQGSDDKSRKIAMLQAQIKNKLSSGVLGGGGGSSLLGADGLPISLGAVSGNVDKPTPLILDSEGRTVDSTGREVQLTHVVPTLKANIRAKKREEFKAQLQEKPADETSEATFFDPRISVKPNVRNRKSLKFHEPGKFQQMADRMRMKAQLQKLQGEISQIAKRTGITSATKLAQIAPKVEHGASEIPKVEWWDSVILINNNYGEEEEVAAIKEDAITHLIEHPIQMKAPTMPTKPVYMPVFLTVKERKKLRRQNRREAWKEEQEKIRLGLEPPPEPKLRISNLMRALGTEAVQDPTKMEAHVKAQMAKRLKAHEDANAARKLTASQRSEKRKRRLMEDTTFGVHVSLYRVKDLSNMTKKFKVEVNCKQLFMTGAVIMYKDCNVVIVEGGPKQTSTYQRLMMNRIKWEEDIVKDADGKESPNSCVLVWQGMKQQRNFGEMKFKICATEKLAREQLRKHGVEHYWDLAYSGTVLENEEK